MLWRKKKKSTPQLRTLLVDSSLEFLTLVSQVLAKESQIHIVGRARSGREAIHEASRLHPDLVLMDVALPDMNGLEVTRMLKAGTSPPKIVLLAVRDAQEYRAAAESVGADRFLAKGVLNLSQPFSLDVLLAEPSLACQTGEHSTKQPTVTDEGVKATAAHFPPLPDGDVRYQHLFDGLPIGIFRTTPAGEVLDANPAMVELLGYPDRLSLMTVNARDLYVQPEERLRWQALLGKGPVQNFEAQLYRCNGTIIWANMSARALRDEAGRALYYEGAIEDISTRKRAEEQLQHSEERYRDLVENSQGLICTHALDGTLLSINPAGAVLLGFEPDELLERNMAEFLDPAQQERFYRYLKDVQEQPTLRGLLRVITKTGEERILTYHNSLRREGGHLPYVLGHALDITDRVQLEQQLRTSEERYRLISQSISDYAFSFRMERTGDTRHAEQEEPETTLCIEWMTDSVVKITGYTAEELTAAPHPLAVYIHPDDLDQVLSTLRAMQPEQSVLQEFRIVTKTGELRWVQSSAQLVLQASGEHMRLYGAARDVTAHKRAEALFAEQARLMTLDAGVGNALTQSVGLADALQQCVEALVQYLDVAGAHLWLLNKDEKMLELQASAGMALSTSTQYERIPVGEGPIGRLVQNPETGMQGLNTSEQNTQNIQDELLAFEGYPLFVEGWVIGVIALFGHDPFTESARSALISMVEKIALGIAQKRLKEVQLQSEEYYRSLLDNTSDLVIYLKSDASVWHTSPIVEQILGYSTQEFLGHNLLASTHPSDNAALTAVFALMLHNSEVLTPVTFRYHHKDGSWCRMTGKGKSWCDEEGQRSVVLTLHTVVDDPQPAGRPDVQTDAA